MFKKSPSDSIYLYLSLGTPYYEPLKALVGSGFTGVDDGTKTSDVLVPSSISQGEVLIGNGEAIPAAYRTTTPSSYNCWA